MDDRRLGPFLAAVAAATALALSPATSRGDDPCSVIRKCSATGLECMSSDRKCESDAQSRGLEVVCDVEVGPTETRLVYCPPVTDQRDSSIVWVLLGAATVLAVAGSSVAYVALRKKP